MSTVETVLSVVTILTSIGLRVSPWPDFFGIHKNRSTGDVALLPVVTLLLNNSALGTYSYAIGNIAPLFVTSAFGVCTSLFFIFIFHYYTQDRRAVYKMLAMGAAFIGIELLYTVLALSGATHQPRGQVGTILGWVTIATSVLQFVAPLATIRQVLASKSSASLPFTMCLMNVVNGGAWVAYALVVSNSFVLAPNVVGVSFGATQVALWTLYRPPSAKGDKAPPSSPSTDCQELVIEMSRSHLRAPSAASTGSAFVELSSPEPYSRGGGP